MSLHANIFVSLKFPKTNINRYNRLPFIKTLSVNKYQSHSVRVKLFEQLLFYSFPDFQEKEEI